MTNETGQSGHQHKTFFERPSTRFYFVDFTHLTPVFIFRSEFFRKVSAAPAKKRVHDIKFFLGFALLHSTRRQIVQPPMQRNTFGKKMWGKKIGKDDDNEMTRV